MFVAGQLYENRRGRYTVLAVRGNMLEVRYEDGIMATLDGELQQRIIGNMRKDLDAQAGLVLSAHLTTIVPPKPVVNWTRYDLWNNSIFVRFFGNYVSGRLVYIDIDDEEVAKMAPDDQAARAPINDFVRAVSCTLDLRKGRLLDRHFDRLSQWEYHASPVPPPFVAALAFFCLTAHRMHSDQQFKTSNYYDRLAQILVGTEYSKKQRDALWAGFQRAYVLWEELEVWLRAQDGRYGLPSARPMYGLSHVGYPISQALLRSHDRLKLPEFFWGASLEPGQEVPPADMERLMALWVPNSTLSQAAKTSWNNSAARRRMAEVASLELSTWDGALSSDEAVQQAPHTTPIAIEARPPGGPRPRLLWGVVFRIPPGLSEATYEVAEGGRGLPMDRTYAQTVTVLRGLGERWSEPVPGVSIADFLATRVSMTAKVARSRALWQPRKVVVLTWDDELKVYRSQQNLDFGPRGMVLAYKSIATKVSEALAPVDAGRMRQVPESWGIPQDWVVFEDVQLTRIPDTGEDPDLDALFPEIWSKVDWGGGIAFPGRKQWLASRLPTVKINSIEELQRLVAEVQRKAALDHVDDSPDPQPFEATGNALDVDLATLDMADGVYGLTVMAYRRESDKTGEDLFRQTFQVRSPDWPLDAGPDSLCHRSDSPRWTLSAASMAATTPIGGTVVITGALVRPERELFASKVELPGDLGLTVGAEHEDLVGPEGGLQRALIAIADCFNGVHHWVLEPVKNMAAFYRPAPGVCKHCGLRKRFPGGVGWKKLLSRESTRPRVATPQEPTEPDSASSIATPVNGRVHDYDGLLEACCTLGGGPWNHFELLARQASSDPMFPHESVHLLSALGHIDIELDPSGTRPAHWKVAPPVLATTASGSVVLAGYRSPRLLGTIESAVRERGGTFTAVPSTDGPTAYWIAGLGQESLVAVVETVNGNGVVHLTIANRPDRSIAGALAQLRGVLAPARTVPGPVMADLFDVAKASWGTRTFANSDGLYRTDSMPRSYLLRAAGTWYQVSYRTGKHLAGAFAGKSLLAYDTRSQQLECPLGAQLPGLYERAVVLSSGLPPLIDPGQAKVIYRQVPKDVASAVWAAVYARGLTRG